VRHESRELEMSTMTVWRVLRKRLEIKSYHLLLVQSLQSFCYTVYYEWPIRKTVIFPGNIIVMSDGRGVPVVQ
jgi:hypothetical protein